MLKSRLTNKLELGCDEAGRGCLAGPVVAAAVILPTNFKNETLNDSKKVSKKQREELEIIIKEKSLGFGIGEVSVERIDKINILNASILAMHRAINKIKHNFNFLLIDGNRFRAYKDIDHQCIIKGDQKYMNIAAASILAKTHRDRIMENLSEEYPLYLWDRNKGYGTKEHRNSILKFGTNIHHRKSFSIHKKQLNLF